MHKFVVHALSVPVKTTKTISSMEKALMKPQFCILNLLLLLEHRSHCHSRCTYSAHASSRQLTFVTYNPFVPYYTCSHCLIITYYWLLISAFFLALSLSPPRPYFLRPIHPPSALTHTRARAPSALTACLARPPPPPASPWTPSLTSRTGE